MTVQDARQAQLLTDSQSRRYFEPFVARECSVKGAAAEVGCTLDTMLYRVRRLLEAGLLTVTREQPRAGRAVKLYRSVADAFFIPFGVTPFASLEERLYEQLEPRLRQNVAALARLLREQGWEGQRLYRDNRGVVWSESARDLTTHFDPANPDAPAVFDVHSEVYLTPDEAKALQLELFRLWQRYRHAAGERLGRKYVLQLAFVPSPSE